MIYLRASAILVLLLTLIACAISQPGPTASFAKTPTAQVSTPSSPTRTVRPTPKVRPTSTPLPTLIPTLDPAVASERVRTSIRLEITTGLNAYPLQRVTGWPNGLRSSYYCPDGPYRWLNDDHLLIYPVTGEVEGMGVYESVLPFIIDLNGSQAWQPASNGPTAGCDHPLWSEPLQLLVAADQAETFLYTPDGKVFRRYAGGNEPGRTTYLSPSGRRVLIGYTWRDLETEQAVNVGEGWWHTVWEPAWSSDESRLFWCCFLYADTRAGQVKSFQLGQLRLVGRGGPGPGSSGIGSHWVLSDTRVMVDYDFYGENRRAVPLIDPVAETYEDIGTLVPSLCWGLPQVDSTSSTMSCSISPRSQSVRYVIDLRTFTTQTLPLSTLTSVPTLTLSADGQQQAFLSPDGLTLNIGAMSVQATYPVSLSQPAINIYWPLQGDSLAVLAQDGSLWWLADAAADRVEQLTPPLPEVRDVKWSPDGDKLAFVSGPDVYVVTVK
jgi:hypothetical protein